MYAIETTDLTKYYGKSRGIIRVNLAVEEGDFFGFIGPNGAGKSTGTLAPSVPGLTTRRRIPRSGRHWSRASGTGSSIPPRKRSG